MLIFRCRIGYLVEVVDGDVLGEPHTRLRLRRQAPPVQSGQAVAGQHGAAPEEGPVLYVCEDYTLDTRRYELCRAGGLSPLDRQVFEVLAYLLAHPEQVVTRQGLFAHLWPQRFVSDAALERCIAVARRALGDSGRDQRFI